ncbi:MAG: N-acetyltransferase [Phycisphaerae bacterium]|nr:N-acetyltransferase [Phycisphaerae bacterium]
MYIRIALSKDYEDVLRIQREAFGSETEAELVRQLLRDPSAKPLLSLLAMEDEKAVGHILLTKATLQDNEDAASIAILAPVAVLPEYQNRGIGTMLIEDGLLRLRLSGTDLVFVLGDPDYYQRFGFRPDARKSGFAATYPIAEEHASAWMVKEIKDGIIGSVSGTVICADALKKPELWRK